MALGQSQSVYVAELVGVRSAIDSLALMLPSYPSNTPLPAHLFLDNQSAVRNSCSSDATPGQSLRLDIHQRYRRLKHAHPHLQLTLHWIPGHEGVEGNEAADEAAKAAALTAVDSEEGGQEEDEEGNVDVSLAGELPKSRSAVRADFELLLPALWDTYWRSPGSGGAPLRRVDLHHPSKHVLRLHDGLPRSLSSLLTQLRTGHSHLLADRFRSRTSPTDRCECGAPETLSHFLLSCPLYRTQRADLAKAVGPHYRNLPLLLTDLAVVPNTLSFVLATGRFSRYHLRWSAAEEVRRRKERRKAKKGDKSRGKGRSKARG